MSIYKNILLLFFISSTANAQLTTNWEIRELGGFFANFFLQKENNQIILKNAQDSWIHLNLLSENGALLIEDVIIPQDNDSAAVDVVYPMVKTQDEGVLVVTDCLGSTIGSEGIFMKYDSLLNLEWVRHFTEGELHLRIRKVKNDSEGNIYVMVSDFGSAILYKFNKEAEVLWKYSLLDMGNADFSGNLIEIDNENNCVAGFSEYDENTGSYVGNIVKFSEVGDILWTKTIDNLFEEEGIDAVAVRNLFLDSSNNIYVTGALRLNNDKQDAFIVKLDNEGNVLWQNRYDNDHDFISEIKTDNEGNVYAIYYVGSGTGFSYGFPYDVFLVKYDLSGNILWDVSWENVDFLTAESMCQNEGVCRDMHFVLNHDNDIYLAGQYEEGSVFLSKISAEGEKVWEHPIADTDTSGWQTLQIATDKKGRLYYYGEDEDSHTVLGQYTDETTSDINEPVSLNTLTSLEVKVNPNPFNKYLKFSVEPLEPSSLFFELIDITGKVIYKKNISPSQKNVIFDTTHLPKGVYTLKVYNQTQIFQEKLVKVE